VMGDSLLDFMNKGARLEPPPDEYYEWALKKSLRALLNV
jgi:hypothetical protein